MSGESHCTIAGFCSPIFTPLFHHQFNGAMKKVRSQLLSVGIRIFRVRYFSFLSFSIFFFHPARLRVYIVEDRKRKTDK